MSPFIDGRGRLFGRVSVVDIAVVALIAVVAILVWMRFTTEVVSTVPVHLSVFAEKVRDPTINQVQVGDQVHDDGGVLLGKVVKVGQRPSLVEGFDDQGKVHTQDSGIYTDIYVDIVGEGRVSPSNITVGGTPMRVGKPLVVVGPGYEIKTQIIGAKAGK